MYRCNSCGKTFEQPELKDTGWESKYKNEGEDAKVRSRTLGVCPFCGNEDYEKIQEDNDKWSRYKKAYTNSYKK